MQDITKLSMDEKIARINALYHKSQKEGLTEDEKAEQQALRKAYLESVRNALRDHLNNIDIQNEDGTIENLGEKFGRKDKTNGTENV